jgi:hypothetical protein
VWVRFSAGVVRFPAGVVRCRDIGCGVMLRRRQQATERGDVVVGLFNTTAKSEVISITSSAICLPASRSYLLNNLWTHSATKSGGEITASVPAHGVALYRVTPGPVRDSTGRAMTAR